MKLNIILILIITYFNSGCTKKNNNLFEKAIIGESFALKGEEDKQFFKKLTQITSVYGYANSKKIYFTEGVDYLIDYEAGSIKRTKLSAIPNYNDHKVIRDGNNKFDFASNPRNPEENIKYQVFVDYKYLSENYTIHQKNYYLSKSSTTKLNTKQPYKICVIGTSITNAAHTISEYYFNGSKSSAFWSVLGTNLSKYYQSIITVENLSDSIGNGTSNGLQDTILLNKVIAKNPGCILIEYGMNDHYVGSDSKGFDSKISNSIRFFKSKGIDVALIGFFRQNPDWNNEDRSNTILFNEILRTIASKENVYFVDVEAAFLKIKKKNMYEDVMGDFIHHPVDFGHKIYFSELLPVFLDKDIEHSNFADFIDL